MQLALASVSARLNRRKSPSAVALTRDYTDRAARLCPAELLTFQTEGALLESTVRQPGRPAALFVPFDSRGETVTSEQFAALLGRLRDEGAQRVMFAIGPADGWSQAALGRADRVLSLGRMTLPHDLARVVVAEQVYRALTILAGHPYHTGH